MLPNICEAVVKPTCHRCTVFSLIMILKAFNSMFEFLHKNTFDVQFTSAQSSGTNSPTRKSANALSLGLHVFSWFNSLQKSTNFLEITGSKSPFSHFSWNIRHHSASWIHRMPPPRTCHSSDWNLSTVHQDLLTITQILIIYSDSMFKLGCVTRIDRFEREEGKIWNPVILYFHSYKWICRSYDSLGALWNILIPHLWGN